MSKKIIVVVGATGAQGSGVVDALLQSGQWAVRGLTRKPDSDSGKALKAKGVEVVAADISKAEDLERAFEGAYGVFHVTNFYEAGGEGEIKQGKLAVDVAKKQNVSHFVYSSLDDVEKLSGGKYKVQHFTGKAKIADYMFQSGLPSTAVQIACYYENWTTFFTPRPNAEGVYEFTLPIPGDTKFALGSVADLGHVVEKVFANKDQYLGKTVRVAGDSISANDIAAVFSKAWGKPVRANSVPVEVFAKFPFPHADELAEMFAWFNEFGYYGEKASGSDIFEGKRIYPGLKTFEQFVQQTLPSPPQQQQ